MRKPPTARSEGIVVHRTVIHLLDRDLDSTVACPWPVRDDYLRWSKFVAVCRSLHRDGMDYVVTIEPHNKLILIGAAGRARPRKPVRPSYSIPDLPTEAQAQKALASAMQALAVRRSRLVETWGWWRGTGYPLPRWDAKHRQTKRTWGRWLASRLARRPRGFRDLNSFVPNLSDYKSGDETFGRKLPRLSQLNKHGRESLGWAVAAAGRLHVHFTRRHVYKPSLPTGAAVMAPDETPCLTQPAWLARFLRGLPRNEPYDPLREYRLEKDRVEYWQEILRLLEERRNGNQGQA